MALYGKKASRVANREIIGIPKKKRVGLSWPIGRSSIDPVFSKASSTQLIRSQLQQLIRTRRGERPMMPDFGLDLEQYLFDPLTSTMVSQIVHDINRSIRLYASNVRVLSVRVYQDENIKGYGMPGLLINLTVVPVGDNQSIDVDVVI